MGLLPLDLSLPDNSLHSGPSPDSVCSGQMLSYVLQADQEQPDRSKVTQQFLQSNKSIQTAVNLTAVGASASSGLISNGVAGKSIIAASPGPPNSSPLSMLLSSMSVKKI